jgi:hypothetical protein
LNFWSTFCKFCRRDKTPWNVPIHFWKSHPTKVPLKKLKTTLWKWPTCEFVHKLWVCLFKVIYSKTSLFLNSHTIIATGVQCRSLLISQPCTIFLS